MIRVNCHVQHDRLLVPSVRNWVLGACGQFRSECLSAVTGLGVDMSLSGLINFDHCLRIMLYTVEIWVLFSGKLGVK